MDKSKQVCIDMRWLAEGNPDVHPRYVELNREDLMGAHKLTDDELAYALAMMSTISDERDTQLMIESHRTGGNYIHKSMLGEIAKDRIRWLSRRVAVLEGRYPGRDTSGNVVPVTPQELHRPQFKLTDLHGARGAVIPVHSEPEPVTTCFATLDQLYKVLGLNRLMHNHGHVKKHVLAKVPIDKQPNNFHRTIETALRGPNMRTRLNALESIFAVLERVQAEGA